jgi:sulfur carrier protein
MQASESNIHVNGAARQFRSGQTVLELVHELTLNPQLIAVEINRQLVRRGELGSRELAPGDRVEIVEFVGGG